MSYFFERAQHETHTFAAATGSRNGWNVATADFTGDGPGIDNATWAGGDGTGPGAFTSDIVVAGTTGTIVDISVTINDFTHTWLGDLNASLSNGGTTVDLFFRPGSLDGTALGDNVDISGNFTFSLNGTDDLWAESAAVIGAGDALDGSNFNFFTSTINNVPTDLGAFLGQPKDGTWTLTVGDNAGGDTGSFSSWTLNITSSQVIPEPTALGLIAGLAGLAIVRRRR